MKAAFLVGVAELEQPGKGRGSFGRQAESRSPVSERVQVYGQ